MVLSNFKGLIGILVFLILLLPCCGKDDPTNVFLNPLDETNIRDEPKYVCYKYYLKPKRKHGKKCKLVYIADIKEFNCKCEVI